MNVGEKYTYWQFIQEHGIVIPLIQRDYAQGREGKAELRKRFLENINKALFHKNVDKQLVLDFVYGVKDDSGNITPLDGQQRLTTLWLLHWYVYFRKTQNQTNEDYSPLETMQKFVYQTRISSRSFCLALCDQEHFCQLPRKNDDILNSITGQTWFMAEWEQDPTVKAMLNMLGGNDCSIEKVFGNHYRDYYINLWEKLTDKEQCPIVFYYLSIDKDIQQEPDDIYIKMNARGEHLTDFENFKADLVKYVRDNQEENEDWAQYFGGHNDNSKIPPQLKLSKLIDTDWTDVFWNDLPKESKEIVQKQFDDEDIALPNIDKQFFAFLNRYFINQILLKSGKNADALNKKDSKDGDALLFQYLYGKEGKADIDLTYKDFQRYLDGHVITTDTFKALKAIFTVLRKNVNVDIQPTWNPDKENFHFLPFLIKSEKSHSESEERLKDISQIHRVVFFGICCYLDNCNETQPFKEESFKEWMRFVWNMARNSDVQTIDSMKNVILKINELRNNTHNIIGVLITQSADDNDTYLSRQWNEEIQKAKILKDGIITEDVIKKAEKIFHGNIAFLLNKQNSLLNENCIQKAEELLLKRKSPEEKNNYEWIQTILPYFPEDIFNSRVALIFKDKSGNDWIKAINYDDDIINAVQNYLLNGNKDPQENHWCYFLYKLPGLLQYSAEKIIHKKSIQNKTSVYLYKRSQWKKDESILLFSEEFIIEESIIARNKFIIDQLKRGYELYLDDNDYKNISYPDEKVYEGRAIGLKKGSDIIYCWASGWRKGKTDALTKYL